MSKSNSAHVNVSETGRLSLPADMRRAVGLDKGGRVRLELVDGVINIRTAETARARIRELAKATGWEKGPSVDDFVAWKREEARRENEEMDRQG